MEASPRVKLMPSEFADIPDEFRAKTRAQLEQIVGAPAGKEMLNNIGYADAELVRRDREFQREMSEAADDREIRRQKFDEDLARRRMDHASKLAHEELDTAKGAEKAARKAAAAWAAALAAIVTAMGVIGQLIVAIVSEQ